MRNIMSSEDIILGLFVFESVQGIQAGGAAGRPKAGDNADAGRERYNRQDKPGGRLEKIQRLPAESFSQ